MDIRKIIVTGLLLTFLSSASSANALDLTRFQTFLSGKKKQPQNKEQAYTSLQAPQAIALPANYRSLDADADAYYRSDTGNGSLVPLANNNRKQQDGEHFLLPPDTRVPKELRPLLSERKTPRQGLSFAGGTGAMLVPSPGILAPGKAAVSVHAMAFSLYNVNNVKYDEDYFDTAVNIAYGSEGGYEISIDKTFANQDKYDIAEPMFFNAKYQIPGNVTLGGSFCLDSQAGYNSVWIGAGVPVAWVAVGANFGAENYKFNYNGYDRVKRAKFGGYNYDYSTAEGYADPVFFLVGGAVPVNDNLRFLYDFNGDKFSLGFRFHYEHTLYLDASYVSNGDYENLPGTIIHKKASNFIFGASIAY